MDGKGIELTSSMHLPDADAAPGQPCAELQPPQLEGPAMDLPG